MILLLGVVSLVIAAILYDPSRGWTGTIIFGAVGVVLILLGLQDD